MSRKIGFWLLWLGFISYAFIFAPPDQPDTLELITNLSTGKITGINPLVIALFNLMGILPMIYACMTLIDGRGQKIPAWLFTSASFAVGAFALLPYLGLRESNPKFPGQKNLFIKILDARLTGIILTIGVVILVAYGVSQGDWSDFVQQWQTSRFIHVMSLDFLTLCLVFPALLPDDMARRHVQNNSLFWVATLIPLFGALLYLCLRPSLPETIVDGGKDIGEKLAPTA
ncbi:DUF2834 domain-containing protein [Calothrix sp. NIES-3974]|uniref:DUF2834 domain-containing protein n=1 Tax=Calothrix sp. NIES-3974 TaxID=2005462 RepID=UPI000BBC6629|nr:DUF2834 domain-containing protein [Calothrix sp. NIES-3974]